MQHFAIITERHLRKQNPKIIFHQLWRQTWPLDSDIICRGKGSSLSVHAWCDVIEKRYSRSKFNIGKSAGPSPSVIYRNKIQTEFQFQIFLHKGVEAFSWKCKNSFLELQTFLQIWLRDLLGLQNVWISHGNMRH